LVSRKDVAVWDIPDAEWGFQDEYGYGSTSYFARKKSSSNVLEKLKQVGETKPKPRNIPTKTPSFTSARERKAAGKKSGAKEKKGKKRKKK